MQWLMRLLEIQYHCPPLLPRWGNEDVYTCIDLNIVRSQELLNTIFVLPAFSIRFPFRFPFPRSSLA